MRDSVPHLALSLLLLVLVSTMPGQLQNHYENVLIWATVVCSLVILLDFLSLVSLSTPLMDYWIRGSLVKKRTPRPHCPLLSQFSMKKASKFEKMVSIFVALIHLLGYAFTIVTLLFGYWYHREKDHDTCKANEQRPTWKMLEISLIVYPTLLLLVELIEMKTSKKWGDYFGQKKNWIDLVTIFFSLTIGLVSFWSDEDICGYLWMPNLIWIVILLSFFQLFDDIVDSIPNNDIVQVDIYRHIFYQVAWKYLKIILGFIPFLCAFAFCFHGIRNSPICDESQTCQQRFWPCQEDNLMKTISIIPSN